MHIEGYEDIRLCIIVTSDSVAYGLKGDSIRNSIPSELSRFLERYEIIPNSLPHLINSIRSCLSSCNVVMITGGTGVSEHDVSVLALSVFNGLELREVGELFRLSSYGDVGSRAYASRTLAKLVRYPKPVIVIAVPGNPDAVRKAMEVLLRGFVQHLLFEASKKSSLLR